MIFVIKQGDYIYITQEKRDFDSKDYSESELLTTLDWDDNDLEILKCCLRPYLDLTTDLGRFKYREEVMNIIESHPKVASKYNYAYQKDVEETINELNNCIVELMSFGLISNVDFNVDTNTILSKVTYKCDIINLLSSLLGDSYDIIEKFQNLKKSERELIEEFYKKASKQEKLDKLQDIVTVDVDRVLPFIPRWYRTNLRLFGLDYQPGFDRFKFSESPEYNNEERMDGNSTVLENQDYYIRKEVYKEFQLDEVWKGKDIKNKFGEIYEKLKTPKSSRVHDIFNYFNTAITRNGYKLLSRKII